MALDPPTGSPAWPTPSLPDWLARRAEVAPRGLALLAGETRWSFRELDTRATGLARRLAALGVGTGEPVGVLCRNGPLYVELVHGLIRRRAVLVPLNVRLTAPELAYQVADVGARLLIHDRPNQSLAAEVQRALAGLRLVDEAELAADAVEPAGPTERPASPAPRLDLAAVHCVVYTSGTTGQPKGVMLTYGNHWWGAVGSALNLGLSPDDRWLAVLPLFHVGGLSILLRGAIYGITAVVQEAFDPAEVNRAIEQDGVTHVSVVSAMLARMLDQRGPHPYPPTLRCVLLGGGPAPRPLLEACAERGVPVVQTYGLTETASQLATLAPVDALRKLGAAGKPLLPAELRIEADGRSSAVGEIGEILVRGPMVTPGYVHRPEATAQALRDGWLHSGDLGYLDADGYLYVVDRRDDLIISGGENIYPAEVEAVLLSHPAVAEAGVTAVPDPRWNQVPLAVVALRPGHQLTSADLLAYCRPRLAAYKLPTRVVFAPSLPRNAAGKLVRRELRGLAD